MVTDYLKKPLSEKGQRLLHRHTKEISIEYKTNYINFWHGFLFGGVISTLFYFFL